LVTGAANGIGQALTLALVKKGYRVVAADLVHPTETVSLGGAAVIGTLCDVTQHGALERSIALAVERCGGLDVMVNNAGISGQDTVFLTDNRQSLWTPTVDVNLTSVIRGTQLAVETMTKQGKDRGGVIINIASLAAYYGEDPVYAATKAGVLRFSRSLHFLTPQRNIRVQAVCPAFVQTNMFLSLPKDMKEERVKLGGGVLEVKDIVDVILKLIEAKEGGLAVRITKRRGPELMTAGERASKI